MAYGGGVNAMEGSFAAVNTIEIHQAEGRITNSVFENNASGVGGFAPEDRFGRGQWTEQDHHGAAGTRRRDVWCRS